MVMVNHNIFLTNMFIKLLSILVVKRNDKITHFRDYRLHLQDIPDTRKLKQQLSSSKIELILESDIQTKFGINFLLTWELIQLRL